MAIQKSFLTSSPGLAWPAIHCPNAHEPPLPLPFEVGYRWLYAPGFHRGKGHTVTRQIGESASLQKRPYFPITSSVSLSEFHENKELFPHRDSHAGNPIPKEVASRSRPLLR